MKKFSGVSLAALAAVVATPTMAQGVSDTEQQESETGLSVIVVTATKRNENLQDVPVAVTAVSSEALANKGVFETSDLNNTMPNLQVSSPYGKQQPNFSIRGVGVGTEFNANAASPVGVYVDEVYQAFRSSHGQQLYDLEQIEVVRGPQGTLYGRNTTGGAVNFITKSPELYGQEGYVTAGYGNFNRFNAEGAIEVTPVEDVFGLRLAASYVNEDPYLRNQLPAGLNTSSAFGLSGLNLNTGRDPGGVQSFAGRLTLRLRPSDGVDLKLKLYAGESKGNTEAPLPTGSSQTSDVLNYQNPNFLLNGLFQSVAGALGPAPGAGLLPATYSQSGNGLSLNQVQLDTVGVAESKARGVVFDARIDLTDNVRLISISGYDDGSYLQSITDCDASPLRLCSIGYQSDFEAFNQDIRFDYDGGPFKLIVGAFYGWDKIESNNRPDFFNFTSDLRAAVGLPDTYFNPGGAFNGMGLSAASLPTGIRATQSFTQVRKSYAGYAEGSYEITPELKITLGGRYTKDKNEYRDGFATYFDDAGNARLITVSDFQQGGAFASYFLQDVRDELGNVVIPSFVGLGIPTPGGLRQRGSSGRFSGRAIVDYKPADDVLLYASYSRGYRAGTFNGLAYGSANQVYFVPPETVNAYEVGLKSRFLDNRLQFNASVFYYDYKGQQGQVVDATATANLVSLDGTLKGFEADLQFEVIPELLLTASFGYLDSEYADGACPTSAAALAALAASFPAQVGSCVVSSGGPVSVAGNPFPFAAKTSASLGFDFTPIDTGEHKLLIHGDANYSGRYYFDSFKDYSRGPLPAVTSGRFNQGEGDYWVLNGRITYTHDERYSISVWGKNLTNKVYYPYGIALENLFANGYRVRSQPRTYGLEATVRF